MIKNRNKKSKGRSAVDISTDSVPEVYDVSNQHMSETQDSNLSIQNTNDNT